MFEKRTEQRDPGERDQNLAIAGGLTDSPKIVKENVKPEKPVNYPGVCPVCKRDMVNA